MNLNRVPSGEVVVIDTNILLYAIQNASEQCKRMLVRCTTGDVTCILPHHILAELTHLLMIAEGREEGWIKGSNPAKQMAEHPDRVKTLRRYEEIIRDLFAVGFVLEPTHAGDFSTAFEIQHRTGLLTNDALLVAIAHRLRATAILTSDRAFHKTHGITVYTPDDLIS